MGAGSLRDLRLYIYPLLDQETQKIITARTLKVAPRLRKLYGYLLDNGFIRQLDNANPAYLTIFSRDALRKIGSGDPSWEAMVPAEVAEVIKRRQFLGYQAA